MNIATHTLEMLKLDEPTTSILLQYIQSAQGYPENERVVAATVLKNKIKKIYGVSDN
jgi:hypothetical protein